MLDITATYDLGIDLGTTYTCAAIVRDGRVEVCQLGATSALVPSIVSLREDGTAVVGDAAERRVVTDPTRTVREFKRRVGDDAPYLIGGVPYTAEQLSGFVLADVVARVSEQEGEPPRRVALTHPAAYGKHKLDRLRDAAVQAGVDAPLFVPEPVAAALAYTERDSVPVGGHMLVYDFGGGTFDAAMIRRDADGPTLVGAVGGLERLGGADLDSVVFDHVDRTLDGKVTALDSASPESRAAIARIRDQARAAKEALSADTDTDIPVLLPDAPPIVRLTRAEFEAKIASRVDETLPVLDHVVDGAGLTWADVTCVLLVGGSSRIPLVAERVASYTGRPVVADIDPKATVAVGAALIAARAGAGAGAAPAGVPADGDEETEPVAAVTTPLPRTGTDTGGTRSRRPLIVAIVAAAVVVLLAGVGGAVVLFTGDDDGDDAAPGASTTTRAPSTTRAPTTTAARGGGTSPTTGPPGTTQTTAATTTTEPAPTVTSLSPDQTLTCAEATAAGNQTTIAWTAIGAASVRVAIDGPGVFQDGLPPEGSLAIPAPCNDVQAVQVTAVATDGAESAPRVTTITIGPP